MRGSGSIYQASLPLALAALALAAVALAIALSNSGDTAPKSAVHDQSAAVARLARRLGGMTSALGAVKASLASDEQTLRGAATETEVAGASHRVAHVVECLQELQTELDGLSVDNYGFISSNQQISHACRPLLYGRSPGG